MPIGELNLKTKLNVLNYNVLKMQNLVFDPIFLKFETS